MKSLVTPSKLIFGLILLFGLTSACNKKHDVTGKVVHAISGEPLVGQTVYVYANKKEHSAITDAEGRFQFDPTVSDSDYEIFIDFDGSRKVIEEDAEYFFAESVDRTYRYIDKSIKKVRLINRDSANVSREWKAYAPAVVSEMFNTQGGSGDVQTYLITNKGTVYFEADFYSGWNYVFGYIYYYDHDNNPPTYFEDSVFMDNPTAFDQVDIFFN